LPNTSYLLVFTTKGSHFFYNKDTKESHWRINDEEVNKQVSKIEKDNLLLLVAKSRGLKLNDDIDKKLRNDLTPKKSEPELHLKQQHNAEQEIEIISDEGNAPDVESKEKKGMPLISGYSSSEDDSDDEKEIPESHERENKKEDETNAIVLDSQAYTNEGDIETETQVAEEDPAESSEEENAINLEDLEGLSSDEEQTNDPHLSEKIFLQLLQESDLNPFSPWETESLKIINDPRFHEIDNNRDRKKIYDDWTTTVIQERKAQQAQNDAESTDVIKEDPFVEFIKFLETRDKLDWLYVDFKKKWKKELKKLKLADKEKEKTYKEYIIYHKKTVDEKVKVFRSFLMGAKIFQKNVQQANDLGHFNSLNENEIDGLDYDTAYLELHSLERELNVSDTLKFSVKYYAVDVKKRIGLIVEIAKLFRK